MREDQTKSDERAEGAQFFQHGDVADARLFAFAFRKLFADENKKECARGNQNQSERDAPISVRGERDGAKSADDQAARPAGVQTIEPFCFVRVEHRGDDGIDIRLHAAVTEAEDDAAPVKQLITVLLRGDERIAGDAVNGTVGRKRERGVDEITGKGKNHRDLVTDAVNEEAEQNNAHAKRPDARADEFADGNFVEAEIRGEPRAGAKNDAADERVARGDEGDEAAPEQNLVVFVIHGNWNGVMLATIEKVSTAKCVSGVKAIRFGRCELNGSRFARHFYPSCRGWFGRVWIPGTVW